ncbi:MAG: hypothetical protein KKD35_02980 [Elusimicrobia bacterium]|nr:hypothetical protein [Elusimicrobiota bacterium]
MGNDFIWDDICFIVENPFVNNCSNLFKILNPRYLIEILPVSLSARPITLMSIILDICSGGLNPAHMRLTNILLHAFNCGLLFVYLNLLMKAMPGDVIEGDAQRVKNEKISLIAAIVFAFHPIAAQVVNIITFRSHLLAVFFLLISLIAERIHYRKNKNIWIIISFISFLTALLSNEMAITLPLIWLLSHYLFDEKKDFFNKRLLTLALSFSLICGFYIWFRKPRVDYSLKNETTITQNTNRKKTSLLYPNFIFPKNFEEIRQDTFTGDWIKTHERLDINFFTMINIFRDYAINLAIPISLSGDYNPKISASLHESSVSVTFFLGLLFLLFYFLKTDKKMALGLAWIGIWLIPASNIIPIINIKADRYLYGALCGYSLLVGVISVNFYSRLKTKNYKIITLMVLFLYLSMLGILTFQRNRTYKNNLVFFNSILKNEPSNIRARLNLISIFFNQGKISLVESHLKEALKLSPSNHNLMSKLALIYLFQERTKKSNKLLEEILIKNPNYSSALFIKALSLWQENKINGAIEILTQLKKNHQDFKEPQIALEYLLKLNGKYPYKYKKSEMEFDSCLVYNTIDFMAKLKLNPSPAPILKELKTAQAVENCY